MHTTPLLAADALTVFGIVGLGVVAVIGLILLIMISQYLQLWLQAFLSGARVSLLDLIMMRLRKVPPSVIVLNRITAKKAGLEVPTNLLEAHFMAGGRIDRVIRAMIAADKAKIDLGWDRATSIDLAGQRACRERLQGRDQFGWRLRALHRRRLVAVEQDPKPLAGLLASQGFGPV